MRAKFDHPPGQFADDPVPIAGLVQQMPMALMNQGKGDFAHSVIVTFIEQMAGVEVKKTATTHA